MWPTRAYLDATQSLRLGPGTWRLQEEGIARHVDNKQHPKQIVVTIYLLL